MEPVNLFDLAAQQSRWLAVRQATVAGNVANANTAGYKAKDVEPFARVLDRAGMSLAATHANHLRATSDSDSGFAVRASETDTTGLPSQNDVVLENEMLKAGEIRRSFELNTAIVKAFHRMTMLTLKA